MGNDQPPTIEDFEGFFPAYLAACAGKDREFLKNMLPPGIPDDEFEFVVESSAEFAAGVAETGAKPVFERNGRRFDAVFREGEGGDSSEWKIDFYHSGGRWLKYDPDAPGAEQGW